MCACVCVCACVCMCVCMHKHVSKQTALIASSDNYIHLQGKGEMMKMGEMVLSLCILTITYDRCGGMSSPNTLP